MSNLIEVDKTIVLSSSKEEKPRRLSIIKKVILVFAFSLLLPLQAFADIYCSWVAGSCYYSYSYDTSGWFTDYHNVGYVCLTGVGTINDWYTFNGSGPDSGWVQTAGAWGGSCS